MVSFPDFDPNLFVGGIESDQWEQLTRGEQKPLFNKAVHGIYPPGSTFKMLVAMAGLDLGLIDRDTKLNCPGYFRMGRKVWYCNNRAGHGDVNVERALQVSCNVFFYQLGLQVGLDNLRTYAQMFGIGRLTNIELDGEQSGLLPSREWKERVVGERWYDGETVPIAIGQGYLTVTPIQLLNYVNVIANRGVWVQPTLLRQVLSPDGLELASVEELPRGARLLPVKIEQFDIVREGLVRVVNAEGGTGRMARSRRFTIAGKTGTSQVVGRTLLRSEEDELDEKLLPHSLFVGFAPAEDPRISVAVLVEHGRSGGRIAAPMARKIMEYYFQEIERLPTRDIAGVPADQGSAGDGAADEKAAFRRQLLTAFGQDGAAPGSR
jgi:penicillin-binding protein 2